ncbi:MAG: MBL fold metallo-hydrolase [Parafannyhessea sp.]|uniref:MBL fold metallo-hydrolase n=1 Tax=Parafannyhessea sp. TaxID=2847324 RepID=UPI003F0078E1
MASSSPPRREAAITHGHFDHASSMGFFDEVAMHPADWDKALAVSISARRECLHTMMGVCDGLYRLTDEDLREFATPPSLRPLREGDVIRLGDRDVLVYETPGHTAGGISFLDVRERILFSGDACWHTILLSLEDNADPVKTPSRPRLRRRRRPSALGTRYDRHYFGHVA